MITTEGYIMKLKRQRAVLYESATYLFGYGGSAKRAKKLYKSVYRRMPARTVARIVATSAVTYRVQRGIAKTLSYHERYGIGVCETYSAPIQSLSGMLATTISTDELELMCIHDSFTEVH